MRPASRAPGSRREASTPCRRPDSAPATPAVPGLVAVPDRPCGSRASPPSCLRGRLLHEILYDHENHERDNDEVDECPGEISDPELDLAEVQRGLAPVSLRRQRAYDRHDEVVDEGGDELAHRAADHDRHRQTDHPLLHHKRLEFAHHAHGDCLPWGRPRSGALVPPSVRRSGTPPSDSGNRGGTRAVYKCMVPWSMVNSEYAPRNTRIVSR